MTSHPQLWVITSYFNPMGYRRRLANYRVFREQLCARLATIELSFDGSYQLGRGAADLLLQLQGDSVLWQKERLLNVVVRALPVQCQCIAWVDADVVFERRDWVELTLRALERAPLVQPFQRVHFMPPDVAGQRPQRTSATQSAPSVGSCVDAGWPVHEIVGRVTSRGSGVPAPGMAWAARREVVEACGFYDACIVGGGDTAFACAALGAFDQVLRLHSMNEHQAAYYQLWAASLHAKVRGCLSSVEGDIYHLWHGDLVDRRAAARHEGLVPFAFDPAQDLRQTEAGSWRWASDKPLMHAYVRDYFALRREDG